MITAEDPISRGAGRQGPPVSCSPWPSFPTCSRKRFCSPVLVERWSLFPKQISQLGYVEYHRLCSHRERLRFEENVVGCVALKRRVRTPSMLSLLKVIGSLKI